MFRHAIITRSSHNRHAPQIHRSCVHRAKVDLYPDTAPKFISFFMAARFVFIARTRERRDALMNFGQGDFHPEIFSDFLFFSLGGPRSIAWY